MKVAAVYLSKQDFAEKLGINENQFIFGDVTSNSNEIEFRLFIDDNADVEIASEISTNGGHWNISRRRMENI